MSSVVRFHLDPTVRASGVTFSAPRSGDAGFDLRSTEDHVILPGAQAVIGTGLRLAIPEGWVGIVKDRSSMALRRLYSHGGVIDASYRGEVKLIISNFGAHPATIQAGDKIAQLLVIPCLTRCEEAQALEELGTTHRNESGFGSTGTR
jgi:dUTP pyrophosphatase